MRKMFEIRPAIGILLMLASVHADPPYVPKQNLYANTDRILGRYDPQNVDYGFSTFATIGYVDEVSENRDRSHVVVDLFPVEYCQAARICITATQSFDGQKKFDINENLCEDYIEYFPPTGKFLAKIGTEPVVEGYTTSLTLTGSTGDRVLLYSKDPFYRTETYKQVERLPIVMANKMFMILTNGRQCHSRVVVDGKVSSLDITQQNELETSIELPQKFNYKSIVAKTKTIYTSSDAPYKAQIDWLDYLKKLTKTASQIGQRKYQCFLPGLSSPKTVTIAKTSVLQAKKVKSRLATIDPTQLDRTLAISVKSCHWVRLWFSDETDWSKYAAKFKPEHAVDLFLHEGFARLPDRENFVQIPLSGNKVDTIMFRAHGDDLVELLLGSPAAPYPIVFKSEILKKDTVNIYLIRSPRCDASFQNNAMPNIMANGKTNQFSIGKCKAYHIDTA